MRIASYRSGGITSWGLVRNDELLPAPADYPSSVLELLDLSPQDRRARLEAFAHGDVAAVPLASVQLLAPIPRPRKNVICLGLNYLEHAHESLAAKGEAIELGEYPVVFTKSPTSVTGPFADVVLDPRVTEQLDWEAELAVIVGVGGRFIPESEALSHVFGYTVVNDLSARDRQFRHKQFFLGKSMDGGCPMGPWIVTADEIPDVQRLAVRCRVNGVAKQDGNTRQQQFGVARTLALLSEVMTLEPGDIIATGTPAGVGFARKPPEFLQPGDTVECEIEHIGTIRNRIVGPAQPQ